MRHAAVLVFPSHGPGVAQPRAARGRGPWCAHRGDGHRRHARHRRSTSRRACCRTAPAASHATSRVWSRTASWRHASATAHGVTSSAPSTRQPSSRGSSSSTSTSSHVAEVRVADRVPLRVVVLGRSFYALHGVRRARAASLRSGAPSPGRGMARHRDHAERRRDAAGVDPARWRECRGIRRATCGSSTTARSRSRAERARRFSTAAPRTRGSAAAPAAWPRTWSPPASADIVYGVGASVWGYAQGPARGRDRAAGVQPAGARRVRRHGRFVRRPRAQERRLRAAARGGPRLRRG